LKNFNCHFSLIDGLVGQALIQLDVFAADAILPEVDLDYVLLIASLTDGDYEWDILGDIITIMFRI